MSNLQGRPIEVYHVFLSSPGDMRAERDCVRRFFESLNRSIASPFAVRFDVVDWENYVDIGLEEPQRLITEQTFEKFQGSLALVIGLMGQRFGTPTENFESGTQAEFEWSAAHKRQYGYPEIKWFFKRIERFEAAEPDDVPGLREAVRQWEQVRRFRSQYQGLYREFRSSASFPEVLSEDLMRWFARWISRKRSIGPSGSPLDYLRPPEVPDFLDDRVSRTLRIVGALEDMDRDPSPPSGRCVRICAVVSSLAIPEDPQWLGNGDEAYFQLLERERDLIEALFERDVSLRILLTWNITEMLDWHRRSREDVVRRLTRLKAFCEKTLEYDERVQRAELVHSRIRERNLLILDDRYLFEGRKLSTTAGFEATEVITNKRRIMREIELFDLLFKNAAVTALSSLGASRSGDSKRQLLLGIVSRIDRDIEELRNLG